MKIHEQIKNLPAKEKAQVKGQEIAKIGSIARTNVKFSGVDCDIEILEIKAIDGGIELLAKAWTPGGKQIGFSKDGSVEIEKFRIFNPPIMVPDGTKRIINDGKQDVELDNYIENPVQAIEMTLAHIISLVGKEGSEIIKGKIGNTTSTFFPAAGAVSPVDGYVRDTTDNQTWAGIIAAAGDVGSVLDVSEQIVKIDSGTNATTWQALSRSIFCFDTSPIATDTVDSATLSIRGVSKLDEQGAAGNINIYTATPATTDNLVAGDYAQTGGASPTAFSTAITHAGWSTTGYNDFVLNASGLTNISTAGVSKFSTRNANYDVAGSQPVYGAANNSWRLGGNYADEVGTTSDPKLVVVHSVATTNHWLLMGV